MVGWVFRSRLLLLAVEVDSLGRGRACAAQHVAQCLWKLSLSYRLLTYPQKW